MQHLTSALHKLPTLAIIARDVSLHVESRMRNIIFFVVSGQTLSTCDHKQKPTTFSSPSALRLRLPHLPRTLQRISPNQASSRSELLTSQQKKNTFSSSFLFFSSLPRMLDPALVEHTPVGPVDFGHVLRCYRVTALTSPDPHETCLYTHAWHAELVPDFKVASWYVLGIYSQ